MKERKTYRGTLKGVAGLWCDKKPRGLELEETIIWYSADEGKCFKKGEEYFDCVIIKDGVDIKDYEEVEQPKEEEDVQTESGSSENSGE